MRIHWLSCLVLLAACGETEVPSSPLDSGAALDAGSPADAAAAVDASPLPDADVIVDAGAADAGAEDVGVECPEGTERQGDECVRNKRAPSEIVGLRSLDPSSIRKLVAPLTTFGPSLKAERGEGGGGAIFTKCLESGMR